MTDMKLKKFIDYVFFYITVPRCVGCGSKLSRTDKALCAECQKEYLNVKNRNCSRCAKKLENCICSNAYLESHGVRELVKVFRYTREGEPPSNMVIYSLKRDNRKDVLDFLTNELRNALESSYDNAGEFVFTNVPRRPVEARKYGIDHARLLSKSLAKRFSAEYYQPIISKSKKPQKKTSGDERLKNARFKLKKSVKNLSGKTVVIVDDVVTTGASMSACTMLLRALGAKKVIGAVISIAYKDSYTPFDKSDRFSLN